MSDPRRYNFHIRQNGFFEYIASCECIVAGKKTNAVFKQSLHMCLNRHIRIQHIGVDRLCVCQHFDRDCFRRIRIGNQKVFHIMEKQPPLLRFINMKYDLLMHFCLPNFLNNS